MGLKRYKKVRDSEQAGTREVVERLQEEIMRTKRYKKLVHEGEFAAEVAVQLIETDDAWSPYLSVEDARKLDEVRDALRRGDIVSAAKQSRVFRLTPIV